jgi:light-regulated signal transduction histidine kinase (bacteriophytochrome)
MVCRIIWPDKSIHWIAAQGRVFRNDKGDPIKMMGVVTEITERKRAEEEVKGLNEALQEHARQLAAANKELEAFSYSVSHDLRAPLRHMDGFAELLQKNSVQLLDERNRRYLTIILESAKQMGQLIDDLLAFSRMGRAEMLNSSVNLDQLVQEVILGLKLDIEGKDIVWQVSPLPNVAGDPSMLRLVFMNLISNALKYTRTRSQVRIEIGHYSEPSGELVVFVRDNGVGFDMQYKEKLFGVFQRLHKSEEFEGTGIGLANVHRIIQRHGGRTWADGKVDEGATFYFSLPTQKEENYERAKAHSIS